MITTSERDNALREQGEVENQKTLPCHCSPKQPRPGTQTARLLDALKAGRTMTPLDAWKELAIMRVADTAFKLRRMGWPIETVDTDDTNQFGEPVEYASYRLGGQR